ncbi:PREDICTED: uncharacterized protein LOC105365335 [Ceratosolen solmsi marchali]|uniref:Uncharacterized protein LOC105365335 n=1 Tax=Ceratosolen solmsi marchali TaxID=326594 RepID=A0AAJ6YPA6_9HYME|nr:PREDICTED: uncharacterized protein LOC105365335 [Ceratosolen solmsi marchali]
MSGSYEECKKWISWIHKQNLENILNSLKNTENIEQDAETNRYLFKLLLLLSHCADRCFRENLSKEIEIFNIATMTCEKLASIPDKNKLFSAIYYILSYLLKRNVFMEAEIICKYLFPGKFVNIDDYKSSNYYQIASLWQTEIFKKLDTLTVNLKTERTIINKLCSYIKFHLQILQFCDENSCYIFKTIEIYIKKLSHIPLDTAFSFLLELFQFLSNYIINLKVLPLVEAYNLMIPIIGLAFLKRNDTINNLNITTYFRQCDSYFLESLKTSSQCLNSYKLFREYVLNLFETNFMSNEIGKNRFKKSIEILDILTQKYGMKNNSIIETVFAITYSFDTLFTNWENLVSKQLLNTNVTYDDILYMGSNFVKRIHNILKNRSLSANHVCKKCPESVKCLMKKDIYNASIATSTYLKIIAKMNLEALNENIFTLAKELIEELVLVFNEFDKSGCKYSSPMWDLCGRTIFNIGLISETKYPAEVEGLYEVLCTQIVHRDGLNSKVSSFGLENPVGTTLHRLCNSNFNQEKYRKAMSYTAYNALLSNYENRKKKAFDMWATIKLKLIDSQETQELTMLKCLKVDMNVVKKFGIVVNLDNYNLNDLCLRELKSLYQVKNNLIVAMKHTLIDLESTNNGLYYAQGVFLLCCHALQFSKRECISDYISKAIQKLINYQPKTPGSQCLLANLNFFNIIEKLCARSQAITKQIDDASFTIKAFKKLKAKPADDELENQDEVVPTYGGINIEEDGKCAKELQNVLSAWENCLFKNVISIVNDWEPKLTLETIIICGEYCRLYKFVNNERKSWNLAYKLSTALQDLTTCVYITSRSVSLRHIDDEWINCAEKHVESIKSSNKTAETDVVAIFWLSLADFYFDCKKIEEGRILLEKVKMMSNYYMLTNPKIYIYSTDIQFRNYYLINSNTSQEDYCKLLVEIHYLMINLHDIIIEDDRRFWNVRFHLFACEQMFEVMYSIIIPMNSLLSFRDVSAHLSYGLKVAQSFGMTLRIAQYLKYLCYIDLLRIQTENCEVRLQDLEHILCLEQFNESMKAKVQDKTNSVNRLAMTRTDLNDPAIIPINLGKHNASPELKKKIFSTPNFLTHSLYCQCFICTNLYYQYLTFSCTYIRAHLYSLLNYAKEAEQYFHGAYKIKLTVDQRDKDETRLYKDYKWKRNQNFTIDALLYMLDLSMFIIDFKPKQKEDALALIEETMEIASQNDLNKHYTCVYATELYFQHYVYDVFKEQLSITVPQNIAIDITNQPINNCATPMHNIEKTMRTRRQRKSSPTIDIPVITIVDTNNANDCGNSLIAKPSTKERSTSKRSTTRNVRRKILLDETEEITSSTVKEEQKSTRKRNVKSMKKPIDFSSTS